MKKIISVLLLLVALAAFWLAGRQNARLVAMRRSTGITSGAPIEDAPPLVTFTTVALGGFRGILADILWLRVSYMQDEGDYFELVQLSDWITKLEPHCWEVWAFHAWNMAYNISAMLPDPSDRWRWVKHGIELLRDEGLVYNAGEPHLYAELGWLFQHKIGGYTDDAHLFYKREWSKAAHSLIGTAYPDYEQLAADPERIARIRRTLKLEPATMRAIDAAYGPLNWLCPETHAIYWAYRGRTRAPGGVFLRADRMIYQSLAALFRYGGRAWWMKESSRRTPEPDPAHLPAVLRAYRHALATYENETVRMAYLNFLDEAIILLAEHGYRGEAAQLYEQIRAEAPEAGLPPGLEGYLEQAR